MITVVEGRSHLVIKRDGRSEPYSRDKLYAVILWACDDKAAFADELINDVDIKIYNKIPISKLYDEVINTAANKISELFPHWETVARNLYLLKIHKDLGVKRTEYPPYKDIINTNIDKGFYDPSLFARFSLEELETLGEAIDASRDNLFTFGGLNLFVQKYCNQDKSGLYELPQHAYMRIAIQLMFNEPVHMIIAKYNQNSLHMVTEGTPKLVNSLRPAAQLFSCCLAKPNDSQESIDQTIAYLGRESKYGGGLATDVSAIRAKGSPINGNKGKSGGVVPFAQSIQAGTGAYNQGSTRSSAIAVYYNWYHYESPEITLLKDEAGKDEDRARKMQYAVKWTRQLTEAIKNNDDVYLFDPHKTQDMTFAFGDELQELYNKYSRSNHVRKRKYSARALAALLAKMKVETGNNYTFFTDNANIQNIGAGPVTQSNLCVTGDTKILTRDGYRKIEELAGSTVECWNGVEWSATPLFKTSDAERILTVTLSNGSVINATAYHKWYVICEDYVEREVRTHELQTGDHMHSFLVADGITPYIVSVVSVVDTESYAPVYCGTEPLRNKLVFNGILTGNCVEYLPNFKAIEHVSDELDGTQDVRRFDGDIALCNLASVNLIEWDKLSAEQKFDHMYLLVRSMDNAIDSSFYSNNLGAKHSAEHRNLGIGVSNYANLLASKQVLWSDEEARRITHEVFEELSFYAIKASIELAKERNRFPLFSESRWSEGVFPHELSVLPSRAPHLTYPLLMDWESLRPELIKYGIRNEYLLAVAPTATSGQCINATPGIDSPRKLKYIQEGTYSLPFTAPNLRENRMFYRTTFQQSNKDVIELAAIRQRFIDMGQSVSVAYADPNSVYEVINDIMYAEELGCKTLYYTYTPLPDDTDLDTGCESCSS